MDKGLEKITKMVEGPDKDKLGTCFTEELELHPAHSNLVSQSPSPSDYLLALPDFQKTSSTPEEEG